MRITIAYPVRPRRRSVHAALVAELFGLNDEAEPLMIADGLELPVEPGTVVAFTGPSGSGKSSLLRAVAAELEHEGRRVVRPDALRPPDLPAIDAIGVGFNRATELLSRCGLAEPRAWLRGPAELSDGQRWRLRLAAALAGDPEWVVVDEFTAALDRTLAAVVAFNVRRVCDRAGVGFLIAGCHEDILSDLAPDLHVRCDHDGFVAVLVGGEARREKSCGTGERGGSGSSTSSKSRPERCGTGRTSLGGITGGTPSAACGS